MFCNIPANQKFCKKLNYYSPGCSGEMADCNYSRLFYWAGQDENGFLAKLFDLKEVLLENKTGSFSVQGFCMYPCLRPADKLYISGKNAEQVKIGEIAVYRRNNRLFAHRTVSKGHDGKLNYIITRADTVKCGNDGRIFDENLVGVVSAIERKGRILGTESNPQSAVIELYLKIFLGIRKFMRAVKIICLYGLAFLQQFTACRKFFRLFIKIPKDMRLSIKVPLNNNLNSLFDVSIPAEELITFTQGKNKDEILKWKIILNTGPRIMAGISFIHKPEICSFAGWWVAEAKISPQCWGLEAEEKMWEKSDNLLKEFGAHFIFASVSKKDYFSRMFFKRSGFKETRAVRNPSRTQIILKKEIFQ
ncbi:MAG TPA: hypothetical protein PKI44_00395 [Candidatus Omnitrophota bacterium]|nr:hypothetical protein [Candidatus Omnitrophota bacterium]